MAAPTAPQDLWRSLLGHRRVLVCAGPGGVGKTTTAAALALIGARAGRRVVALTVDPARRLADSLGVAGPGAEPRAVDPKLWRDSAQAGGSLTVMVMDTKRTFDEVVERHASSPEARDRILNNALYRHVSNHLAGAHEYMAMEKLLAIKSDPRFDLLVLDTPPTRNALDFLSAPERLVTALDSSIMGWLGQALHPTGGLTMSLLARGVSRVLGVMGRITGRELLEQLASFVVDLNDLFGGFRQRASAVARAFRGPEFGFVIVASPRPTASAEGLSLLSHLAAEGMTADAFVLNRMHVGTRSAAPGEIEAALRAHGLSDAQRSPELLAGIQRALTDHQARAQHAEARAQHVATEIERRVRTRPPPLVRVPELPIEVHGLDGLQQIARWLLSPPSASAAG